MSIVLDQDIYKWLLGLDVLKMTACSRQHADGRIELDPSLTSYFSTGLVFSRLIAKIVKNLSKTVNMGHVNLSSLESIKLSPTQASMTYNWNVIADVLKQLHINIDKDVKELVINGDFEMIHELLRQIHDHYHPKNHPNSRRAEVRGGSVSSEGSVEASPKKPGNKGSPVQMKTRKFETDAIDIEKVKANKELENTTTVLEFFLVSLSKHLALEPKQAVTLLTNNFKYLAHILAKGVKGFFEPVVSWYEEVADYAEHLVTLIEKDRENNVVLVQQACRPGLLSKNAEVVENACTFFYKIASEFTNRSLMPLAWDWFISEASGLQGCLLGLKRHPELAEHVILVLMQYSRFDMIDLFTIHLKNACPDIKEQVTIMMLLFKPLNESTLTKDELLSSGVLDAWVDTGAKFLENDAVIDGETRQIILSLLCEIWMTYQEKIEQQDYVSTTILNGLKRAARDRSKPVAMTTICLMFRLLEYFAAGKNNYAAVIYKTLTFSLIENYNSISMRDFLLRNFKIMFEMNPTVPIGILLDPLLKHMQGNEATSSLINVFEMEFFSTIIKHPKFSDSQALQVFYVMADVYLNNLAFSRDSLVIIFDILNNFLRSDPLQEAVIKFIKASLAMFYSSEKNKKPKPKPTTNYLGQVTTNKAVPVAELEAETLKAQKRGMIVQILRAIIELNNNVVNEKAKTFVIYTHIQLKTQLKTEHKGILSLLSLFGDPEELVAQFEKDNRSPTKPSVPMDLGSPQDNKMEDTMAGSKSEADALNFLKGVTISPKLKALQASKLSSSDSTLKKLPKPDPKIEEELVMIQREFQRKKLQQIDEENLEKDKIEKQKKKLKVQLDKRKIELGVASRNQSDAEVNIVFEEGSRELEKLLEKKHGLPEIELLNLEDEEERDKEAVDIFMKKYYKILHYLFVSYANVGFTSQDYNSFSKMADRMSNMNLNDIWKLLSEHDCTKYTNKEEVHTLVRLINTKIHNRSEIKSLTFPGFKDFFVQFAVLIYSRPPKDLSHMPVFVSVETLLQAFKEATQKKGKTTLLYDDPYATEVGDKDLHSFLNDALSKDPEYPLPEAYKKITEKNVDFSYRIPDTIQIPDKYLMCYQILEDILNEKLGVRLIEPIVSFNTVTKAKLKLFDPNKIDYSPDHHLKPTHGSKKLKPVEVVDPIKRRQLVVEPKAKLSLELKKEVANYPYKDRAFAEEAAQVLEKMLQLVEEGKTSSEVKEKSALKAKMKEAKEKEKEEQMRLEALAEKKRKQRVEELKTLTKEMQAKKEEAEKAKAQQESPTKKKEEQRAKYVAELKEKAKEIKEKKEEEKKKKEEEEERKKKAEEEEKKNKFKTFQTQKVEDTKKKVEDEKKKKEEEEKKKKEKEEEEKKKKAEREKQRKEILEKDKEKRERQRQMTSRIKEMLKESSMKKVFEKYDKQLQVVFRYYIDNQHLSLAVGHALETLPFQGFASFGADFNIFPGIIPLNELRLLFNTITIGKEVQPDVPMGITYEEFMESMMRIAIKGREKLDKIYNIKRQLQDAKDKEAANAAEAELKKQTEDQGEDQGGEKNNEEDKNNQEDKYEEIEGTTRDTLEGLMFYLDLPKDKVAVRKKLEHMKEQRPKNWREKINYWKKDLIVEKMQGLFPGMGGGGLLGMGGAGLGSD